MFRLFFDFVAERSPVNLVLSHWGEAKMLRTITIGSHVQVQGLLVRTLENGKVIIAVGGREYEGTPVTRLN